MACGTGKTFTSLKAAEEVATSRKGEATTVLSLMPSIQLLNQTLREWKQESEIPFRAFAVCSDVKVGRHSTSEDMSVHDLVVPGDQFTVVFSPTARRHRNRVGRNYCLFPHSEQCSVLSFHVSVGAPQHEESSSDIVTLLKLGCLLTSP